MGIIVFASIIDRPNPTNIKKKIDCMFGDIIKMINDSVREIR